VEATVSSRISTTAVRAVGRARPLWVIGTLAAVIAASTLPAFRTSVSINSLLVSMAPILIISIGQGIAVMSGGIDLSVGAVAGLATVILSLDAVLPGPTWVVLFAAVLAGMAVGLVNGLGVVAGINPLLMTFALAGMVQGCALLLQDLPEAAMPFDLITTMGTTIGTVPLTIVAALVLLAAAWYWVAQGRTGRVLQGAGYDPRTAVRLGLPVTRSTLVAYALSGGFAAAGGMVIATRTYTADALIGSSSVIDSVATVLVAGIVITGGIGSLINLIPAALVIAVIGQTITLTGTNAHYQTIFKGILLVAAVSVYQLSGRRIRIPWQLRRPALPTGTTPATSVTTEGEGR
jgi:ribose/xylose/arabinose/galactoside ABC-type transport system permease subunit